MDTSRLKNIAILILLALDLAFLVLVGLNRYEAGRAGQEEKRELAALFHSAGIEVEAEELPDAVTPELLLLSRDPEAEHALVTALLGEATLTDQGGNIYSYENQAGSALFRGSGEFEFRFARLEGSGVSARYGADLRPDPVGPYELRVSWEPEAGGLVNSAIEVLREGRGLYTLQTAVFCGEEAGR